ncbi:hypothetical protein GCM10010299_10260 [Streptomyces tanashiensis]|nr:hypothetical protein GCM10010299_10260 [Streptomyces tanashiensis]
MSTGTESVKEATPTPTRSSTGRTRTQRGGGAPLSQLRRYAPVAAFLGFTTPPGSYAGARGAFHGLIAERFLARPWRNDSR